MCQDCRRCTMEAGYTTEEHAKVLVLMGGFLAIHPASAIVTDVGQDAISCRQCKLQRICIRNSGTRFRKSPCPEESSTPNRAMWITCVCKIRTREEAVNQRWRLQCLMRTEHKNADAKQMVTSVAAANRNVKRRLPPPDVDSANNESTGDRVVSST